MPRRDDYDDYDHVQRFDHSEKNSFKMMFGRVFGTLTAYWVFALLLAVVPVAGCGMCCLGGAFVPIPIRPKTTKKQDFVTPPTKNGTEGEKDERETKSTKR